MTAKSHGLEEECQSILEASGLTEDQIALPAVSSPIKAPVALVPTHKANWPVKTTSSSNFEKALLGDPDAEQDIPTSTNGFGNEDLLGAEDTADADGHDEEVDDDEDAAGWDMGDDVDAEVEGDFVNVDSADVGSGSSEADLWARNSPLAADHIAGGSFETAMQLLNRQVGAVNFKPLQGRFEEIYQSSRTFLPASPGLLPLVNYVRRTVQETDTRKILPIIPRDLESVVAGEVAAAKSAMRTNKLEDGLKLFKKILHVLMVNAVTTPQEVTEVRYTAEWSTKGVKLNLYRPRALSIQLPRTHWRWKLSSSEGHSSRTALTFQHSLKMSGSEA